MTFDTLQNTSECHEVPRLPRETQKLPLLENLPEARPYSNHADGYEGLRTVGQRAWRRVGKAEVEVEVDADMIEEKLEEEAEEEEKAEDEDEEDS